MRSHRRTGIYAGGFTLVEALLAVLLGGIVTATATSICVQIVRTQAAAREQVRRTQERARVLDQFAEDLNAILLEVKAGDTPIEPGSGEGVVFLTTALSALPQANVMGRVRLPARIVYRRIERGETIDIHREVDDLTTATQDVVGRTIAQDLAEVSLWQWVDGGWNEPVGSSQQLIAYQLRCRWSYDPERTYTKTVIVRDDRQS